MIIRRFGLYWLCGIMTLVLSGGAGGSRETDLDQLGRFPSPVSRLELEQYTLRLQLQPSEEVERRYAVYLESWALHCQSAVERAGRDSIAAARQYRGGHVAALRPVVADARAIRRIVERIDGELFNSLTELADPAVLGLITPLRQERRRRCLLQHGVWTDRSVPQFVDLSEVLRQRGVQLSGAAVEQLAHYETVVTSAIARSIEAFENAMLGAAADLDAVGLTREVLSDPDQSADRRPEATAITQMHWVRGMRPAWEAVGVNLSLVRGLQAILQEEEWRGVRNQFVAETYPMLRDVVEIDEVLTVWAERAANVQRSATDDHGWLVDEIAAIRLTVDGVLMQGATSIQEWYERNPDLFATRTLEPKLGNRISESREQLIARMNGLYSRAKSQWGQEYALEVFVGHRDGR